MAVDMIPANKNRLLRGIFLGAGLLVLSGCWGENETTTPYAGAMVLALSWQPAFCETRPKLPECRSQKPGRFDTNHFSLHGLWPQPGSNIYCDVDETVVETDKARRWKQLAGLSLSDALKQNLWQVMPGARSFLHRHEWVKHGTCYAGNPETYYANSLVLMEAINASPVRDLFVANIGKPLSNQTIRRAFDDAFGAGVGNRIRVSCKRDGNRSLIVELTMGLNGSIGQNPDIGTLALAARETKPGCPRGLVDPVGLQ